MLIWIWGSWVWAPHCKEFCFITLCSYCYPLWGRGVTSCLIWHVNKHRFLQDKFFLDKPYIFFEFSKFLTFVWESSTIVIQYGYLSSSKSFSCRPDKFEGGRVVSMWKGIWLKFNNLRETLFLFSPNGNILGHVTPMTSQMISHACKWCHFCRNPYKRSPRGLP